MTEHGEPARRRWPIAVVLVLALLAGLGLLATESEPWVEAKPAPTAQQVVAAQDAYLAVKADRPRDEAARLTLDQQDLDAIAALIDQGFAPNRVAARLAGDTLTISASRKLPLRWLNVSATIAGESEGVPIVGAQVGAIPLPPALVRWALDAALKSRRMPPLEEIVRSTRIADDRASATIGFTPESLALRLSGGLAIDDARVAASYCDLTRQQRSAPADRFVIHLRRAIAGVRATREDHGAALVALAMFAVGREVGKLSGAPAERAAQCALPPFTQTLQGRPDSPQHWSLSASLWVTSGARFTTAMGEWKELADSLVGNPLLAPGDPSGFSFVDLAANRAGFKTAQALTDPARLAAARARMLAADDDTLLPRAAVRLPDGLSNEDFIARYGAIDDPRFEREVTGIDRLLAEGGID